METNFKKLDYIPETGELCWNEFAHPKVRWKIAGSNNTGYIRIRYEGKLFYAHRIVWYMLKKQPLKGVIDHINGNRTDNRIENLRDVTQKMNSENVRKANKNNKTGFLGVEAHIGGMFKASIISGENRIYLGLFKTPEEAHAAYIKTKRSIHSGCTI